MTTRMTAELVVDGRWETRRGADLGHRETGELVFVDIPGRQVLRHRPGEDGVAVDARRRATSGASAVRRGGGLVAALVDGFWVTEPGSSTWTRLAAVEDDLPDRRFNDGKCDPTGRFLAGSMAYDKRRGAGAFYRLDPDGTVEQLLTDITISNGLTWSPDGDHALLHRHPDEADRGVRPTTSRPAASSHRRTHVALPDGEPGSLDGMTMDTEGGLWVALWGGWKVVRFGHDGRIDAVIEVPASHVTSCTFGGPDLEDLYITCAWSELTDDERAEQPHAGSLFVAHPGVRGYAPVEFAG